MKSWLTQSLAVGLAALVSLASMPARVLAQEAEGIQPVAVIAIASIDEVLGDIAFVTESAGQGDFGKMVALLSGGYTVGMDKKRPLGLVVTLKNDEPKAIAFLPVKNLDAVLAGLEEQLGKPEDAGDGILELGGRGGNPVYVKEVDGWAYVSQKANDLAILPRFDPAATVSDLTKNYTLGVQINVGNIPAEMKKAAVAQMQAQFERQLQEKLDEQPESQRAVTERYTRTAMEQFTSLIEDTERFTVGLQIDAQAKTTHLDFALVARPDTKLAEQMALLKDVTSANAGFLAPDAAIIVHAVNRLTKEDIELYQDMLKVARENSLQEIEKDEDIESEETRQIAKEVINALFDVGEKTVAAGVIDGGGALFLTPEGKASLVAGGTVKDAARLEETLKKLVEAAKNEPKAPKVNFNTAQHAGVRFHTMSLPIPEKEQEARRIFGQNLDVALGFGQETVIAAFGPSGVDTAKKILDNSQAKKSETVPPAQLVVALGPILKFASAIKEDPVTTMLAATLEQSKGQDHISLKAEALERGFRSRLEIEQGVLQLVGAAIKLMSEGAGQQQPF